MADEPRSKKPLLPFGVPIAGATEKPSGRHHRDRRRDDDDDFESESISNVYEGEELRAMRSLRSPDERMDRLEIKHDKLKTTVNRIEVAVAQSHGELTGKLDTLVELAGASAVEREKRAAAEAREREQKRRHIVPIIKAVGVAIALIAAALIGRGTI